jgi:hypothetical protein
MEKNKKKAAPVTSKSQLLLSELPHNECSLLICDRLHQSNATQSKKKKRAKPTSEKKGSAPTLFYSPSSLRNDWSSKSRLKTCSTSAPPHRSWLKSSKETSPWSFKESELRISGCNEGYLLSGKEKNP